MSRVLVTKNEEINVAISLKIARHHIVFAKEIRDAMGKVNACKYLYHVYPQLSLLDCKGIVEHYLD